MRKLIILCVALMMISSIPTAMAAITVDGYKSSGEWNENWAFGQAGTGYDPWTPGDRMLIWQQGVWLEEDPDEDAGTGYNENLATVGPYPSGYDIHKVYAHYDAATDTLYGLVEVYGKPGDLDGDGDVTYNPAHKDSGGDAGPAGYGVGDTEYFSVKLEQGAHSTIIDLKNNDWEVQTNCLIYGDVLVKFSSDKYDPTDPDALPKSVYECKFTDISDCYSIGPGDELMITIIAGAMGDVDPNTGGVLGEDIVIVSIQIPEPDIRIKKYVQDRDDNWLDANSPSGPNLTDVSPAHFWYRVTNTGDEPLINVVVTDDQFGPITCPKDTLDVGEQMDCYTTLANPCPIGGAYHVNWATVNGVGVVSEIPVTDRDPAHYTCGKEVPALTPAGLMGLIGLLGIIGIIGLRRRD